jgi:P4 family phage/plasmid primase-like protien
VLDVDNKGVKNGSAALKLLEERWGQLPQTFTVQTATGGLHYYFMFPDALRGQQLKKELAPGLDLKFNGYVVAPPSSVNGSSYDVLEGELTRLTDWPQTLVVLSIKQEHIIDPEELARRACAVSRNGGSFCDEHEITLADVLTLPSNARRVSGGHLIEHPIHGATGDGNLYINPSKNLWCCYRCDSGGDPITWVAVREGFIDCAEAGAGSLEKETFKKCVNVLRDEGLIKGPVIVEPDGSTVAVEIRGCEDDANAQRFVSKYGDKLRYCSETRRWLEFNGRFWEEISSTTIRHRAIDVATIIRYEAAEAGKINPSDSKAQIAKKQALAEELNKWARQSSFKTRLDALIDRATGYLEISLLVFDHDPLLVNCENGVYNVRTGECKEGHNSDDYFTQCAGPYIEGATSEAWLDFLTKVQPNADVRAFLKRAAGYSTTGLTNEEALFFAFGEPGTGKSTFEGAIKAAIGTYGKRESFNTFLMSGSGHGRPRPEMLRLRGSRFVSCIEVSENTVWDSPLLNTLVSGESYVARALFSNDVIEFNPTFKLWCFANHRPRVQYNPEEEDGFWRRLYPIPFNEVIPENEQDKSIKGYFIKDADAQAAILAWVLEGATEWYKLSAGGKKNGLQAPLSILAARYDYQAVQSPIYDFIRYECLVGTDVHGEPLDEEIGRLWAAFSESTRGYDTKKVKGTRSLGRYLKGFKFEPFRDSKTKAYMWRGLRLLRLDEYPCDAAFQTWIALAPRSWLFGSLKGAFWESFHEYLLHEGEVKKQGSKQPNSHNLNEDNGDHREHLSEIERVRNVIFDVLMVIEERHRGQKIDPNGLVESIVNTANTVDDKLELTVIKNYFISLLRNDRDFLARLERLTGGRFSNFIRLDPAFVTTEEHRGRIEKISL